MNSVMTLRWNQGGRNVSSPTSQRGGKMAKSTVAAPGRSDGAVSTLKIDGSGWSKLIEPITLKRAKSYLYGTKLPCQATTLSGERFISAAHRLPWNFATRLNGPATSSYAATGARKSRALARPLAPSGPSSGKRNNGP